MTWANLRSRTTSACVKRDSVARAARSRGLLAPIPKGETLVEVDWMRIYPDSVVISASGRRPGVTIGEEYVLVRRDSGRVIGVKLSRQTLLVVD